MKIGQLARSSGFSVETLRYYEREGLIPPALRDDVNNYRHYQQVHLDAALFIRRCRALDMSHEEIRTLLDARARPEADCHAIDQLIESHLQHVQRRIDELQALEQQLIALRNSCLTGSSVRDCAILQHLEQPAETHYPLAETHLSGSHHR